MLCCLSRPARLVLLLLAVAVLASPAEAASKKRKDDKPAEAAEAKGKPPAGVWGYGRDAEAFVLQYGVPKAPAPLLVATCRPGAGLFQIVVELSPPKAQPGDAVRLTLGSGKTVVEFAGSAFPSASPGQRAVEAQAKLEPKLVEVFKAGESLRIGVPGASETVPLTANALKRIAQFEAGCLKAKILPAAN